MSSRKLSINFKDVIDWFEWLNLHRGKTILHAVAKFGQVISPFMRGRFEPIRLNTKLIPTDCTALLIAVSHNYLHTVENFVRLGADVNSKAFFGFTALNVASQLGFLEMVKGLINNGADLKTKTDHFDTPLHLSAENGHLNVVKILIEKGLDIDASNKDEARPLHLAVQNGHISVVKTLLANGCNVNCGCKGENNEIGIEFDTLDIVNSLILFGGVDYLFLSIHMVFRNLFTDNFDKVYRHDGNITPLHVAVQTTSLSMVNVLLDANANVNAKTTNGVTPLHIASRLAFLEGIDALLKHGADVNLLSAEEGTALHLAAHYGYYNLVKILISNGADVNSKMKNNTTPLHLAAENNKLEVVKYLIMNGAYFDATMNSRTKSTALNIAERKLNTKIVVLIKLIQTLFKAVLDKDCRLVEYCIEKGVIINSQNNFGITPLHYAVNRGCKNIVKLLLTKGANVTIVTNKGNTPLHIAVSKGHKELVETLLQHSSSNRHVNFINAQTSAGGSTSLHVASEKGHWNIVKSLLKYGAIYNIKNNYGKKPLELSQNSDINALLKLVEELFEDSKKGDSAILVKLKTVKQSDIASVMNARNNQGQTLAQVAIISNHKSLAEDLLEICIKI